MNIRPPYLGFGLGCVEGEWGEGEEEKEGEAEGGGDVIEREEEGGDAIKGEEEVEGEGAKAPLVKREAICDRAVGTCTCWRTGTKTGRNGGREEKYSS